jgi:hypothetical protein
MGLEALVPAAGGWCDGGMTDKHEEKRRTERRAAWSRAMVLWLDGEQSYTIRGHVRDVSAEGCSVVSLSAVPVPIGAIAAPDLDLSTRFQVAHTRSEGLLQVTGLRFLASMPAD